FQDIMQIKQNANRAAGLVRQLLAFSRRQTLRPQTLQLNDVLSELQMLLRRLVGEPIALDVVHSRDLWLVKADINQFEQVIVNLVVNARDAMPEGGRITLRTRNVPAAECGGFKDVTVAPADYVLVEVQDTGHGIPPGVMGKIFEPFFTTKEVGKGTGLGLSQAFGFAKQSGGDIAVMSALGHGATFTIYLPQSAAPADATEITALGSEPATTGRGYSVLVVEDNDDVGQFSTELLEDLGYAVRRVANAKAALSILAQDEFAVDLVFSDVIMPGMNGVELAGVIGERYPGLPVVLTSGYSHVLAENAHRGFELIQKPYSVEALSRILRKAISKKTVDFRS
ncbi:ATP-binding protein, partial [Bradyrhizobium sp.]|uniref:ATP-binding protein n=1 Tax=Bradyrhizobium sp. TaxID=376 RepID=UPI003C5415FF